MVLLSIYHLSSTVHLSSLSSHLSHLISLISLISSLSSLSSHLSHLIISLPSHLISSLPSCLISFIFSYHSILSFHLTCVYVCVCASSPGVLIAYRRDIFQLFKSQSLELNNCIGPEERGMQFMDRCRTDDVAQIVFLQPWRKDFIRSPVCVCCANLSDTKDNSDVRMVQCQYIAQQIELANRDFHVPVVIAMSMYDNPDSPPYTVMRTGRTCLNGQVPSKYLPARGEATCRGSIRLSWMPPPVSIADPPLSVYRIAWRPGDSYRQL